MMQQIQLASLGPPELLIILVIVLVLFGATRLPQIGEGLGKAIRNFRKSYRDQPREVDGEARRLEEGERAELPPGREPSEESKKEERASNSQKRK